MTKAMAVLHVCHHYFLDSKAKDSGPKAKDGIYV
jgi:hypothetical protein